MPPTVAGSEGPTVTLSCKKHRQPFPSHSLTTLQSPTTSGAKMTLASLLYSHDFTTQRSPAMNYTRSTRPGQRLKPTMQRNS